MARSLRLALLLLGSASVAQAQVPAGPEFRVNAFTTATQQAVSAAPLAAGEFVIVMNSSGQDGSSNGSVAQRFSASGARLGAEFVVNTYTTGSQTSAFSRAVSGDRRGRFVVGFTSDQAGVDTFVQRFAASGAKVGAELRANTYTIGSQSGPQVAAAADGSFVVVWSGYGPGSTSSDIFGQRFDAAGTPRGGEFRVNTYTTGAQATGSVFGDASGRFVVVWLGGDGDVFGVLAQRYDAAGQRIGGEFVVNTSTVGLQRSYGGAMNASGELVVTWLNFDPSGQDVFAQRFDAAFNRAGAEFRVNAFTTGYQGFGTAGMDEQGNFVIAWMSDAPGDGGSGMNGAQAVFGQRFTASGLRRGAEFRANTYTTGDQVLPVVATDDVGNFVVTWMSGAASGNQDGSVGGAFAQRYGGLRPAGLSVTDGANGVLEVPEDFALVTSWRNVNGAPQTFQGASSAAMVPPGLFLTLGPAANYGTVADGAVGACSGPCFSGAVTGTRPAGHVDLSFLESIQPDAQGQQKRWRVHLGDSFSDVPRTNPFYRFIETLLHHGVTAGCAPNAYCPSTSTTREGMAVFVLAAKEGAGYVPPDCTVPVFNDVPAGSPFCAWVEELARRGVVGGCGGGNYCPADAVTREQMAVFVLRTLDEALSPPACGTPVFGDVPASSPFCRWIEELARRGVVTGCGGGNYCPAAPVTREQMGVFISLTFGLSLYGP